MAYVCQDSSDQVCVMSLWKHHPLKTALSLRVPPVSSLPQGGALADPWCFSAHILRRFSSCNSSQGSVLSDFLHFDNSNKRSYKGYSDHLIPITFALFPGKHSS